MSNVLVKPIEILGDVIVNLYASSDALDTDFIARILDIYSDGRVINVGPKPELFAINLSGFGFEFLEGHRFRLEISSSSYPNINPNQNTGNPIATDTEWKIAHQSIYHDKLRPSHILLPIISNGDPE
jgi:putative CocE/NonD family hydrolase